MIAGADGLRQLLNTWVGLRPPPSDGVTAVGDPARSLPPGTVRSGWVSCSGSAERLGTGVFRTATSVEGTIADTGEGGVPTYLHEPSNVASARVAEAVGFIDQGWTVRDLWPRR